MEAEEAAAPARKRLDYRGKMILAPMVKVIIVLTERQYNAMHI